jgi:hypothetical protein
LFSSFVVSLLIPFVVSLLIPFVVSLLIPFVVSLLIPFVVSLSNHEREGLDQRSLAATRATSMDPFRNPRGLQGIEHPGNGGGHEGGQRSTEHRFQAQLGKVCAAARCQTANTADLDCDRGEVGKAAQSVS